MKLDGQVAIVTGGGRGIGRAIALALANEGADVIVCARTRSEIESVATEIEQLGREALAISVDVSVESQVEQLVARAQTELGDVDILVNSAGGVPSELYDASGSLRASKGVWDVPEAGWDRILEVNLKSVFLCTKAVLPQMMERRRGNIVNVASSMGRKISATSASYTVAKHGVIALTQVTALQVASFGVRVNAVSPGMIDTPGQRRILRGYGIPGNQFPPMGSPESVAEAVLYLLCDAPSTMTGQSLDLFPVG